MESDRYIIPIEIIDITQRIFYLEFTLVAGISSDENYPNMQKFISQYAEFIPCNNNLILLFNLKNEKKFLKNLSKNKDELGMKYYSLICIDRGYIASTWLKQI